MYLCLCIYSGRLILAVQGRILIVILSPMFPTLVWGFNRYNNLTLYRAQPDNKYNYFAIRNAFSELSHNTHFYSDIYYWNASKNNEVYLINVSWKIFILCSLTVSGPAFFIRKLPLLILENCVYISNISSSVADGWGGYEPPRSGTVHIMYWNL